MEITLQDAISITQQAQSKLEQISREINREQIKNLFIDVSDFACLALECFTDEVKTEANTKQIEQAIDLLDRVSIRASELGREVFLKPYSIDDYLKAEANKLKTFTQLVLDVLSITDPADLYAYALASYCPTGDSDEEADLIVNDESMKFLEVRGFSGTVKGLREEHADMMKHADTKDVLIVHIGTIHKLSDALSGMGA
ncbi:hypothetical protein OC498_12910 [Acinetobacter bohemicus]|uniref:hypothetical protein n=1 Tax=Acinetobacter TaxID=469 RepID=UPI00209AAA8C|nr:MULTISPECIES: hypothetical protein [Acinetobacter]MCO8043559.1 hypothetical protein [Acinetobacter sp. S4400-12]MCO8044457.1 hypothetical protein [Acinetobacter sp. S4397-1]MCU7225781.1 hypothetical protein [Acinetobacter bohemicus]